MLVGERRSSRDAAVVGDVFGEHDALAMCSSREHLIIRGTGGSLPALTVARTADGVALTYTGTLQAADVVNGTYSDVTGATSPYSERATNAAKFFRAKQ